MFGKKNKKSKETGEKRYKAKITAHVEAVAHLIELPDGSLIVEDIESVEQVQFFENVRPL